MAILGLCHRLLLRRPVRGLDLSLGCRVFVGLDSLLRGLLDLDFLKSLQQLRRLARGDLLDLLQVNDGLNLS